MQVWRICRRRCAKRAYDGEGARRFGGRWNRRGDALAYASPTLSLAALELFVNLATARVPKDLVAVPANFPDELMTERWEAAELPRDWMHTSPLPEAIQNLGSEWIASLRTAVLLVPSVVIPEEFNVLLNPAHPDYARLEIGRPRRFEFDRRMWKQ
jgi:RES domain-containing protein